MLAGSCTSVQAGAFSAALIQHEMVQKMVPLRPELMAGHTDSPLTLTCRAGSPPPTQSNPIPPTPPHRLPASPW